MEQESTLDGLSVDDGFGSGSADPVEAIAEFDTQLQTALQSLTEGEAYDLTQVQRPRVLATTPPAV